MGLRPGCGLADDVRLLPFGDGHSLTYPVYGHAITSPMNDFAAPSPPQGPRSPDEETVLRALTRVGMAMGLSVRQVTIDSSEPESADPDPLHVLMLGAKQSGIYLKETRFDDVDEVIGFVERGLSGCRGPCQRVPRGVGQDIGKKAGGCNR